MLNQDKAGLYIAMISVHGLIRGHELELGKDADTGGQTKYVVELALALARLPGVASVDLFTRLVSAHEVDADYSEEIKDLGDGVRIVRIVAGPAEEYLPKEALWNHLDSFVDNMLAFLRDADRAPVEEKSLAEITFLDPACGSGHFLIEAFDLYYDM